MSKAFSGKPFHVDRASGTVLGSYPFWLPPGPETHVLSHGSETQAFSVIYVGPLYQGGRRAVFLVIGEDARSPKKSFIAADAGNVYGGFCT